jgi:hypothetical protein
MIAATMMAEKLLVIGLVLSWFNDAIAGERPCSGALCDGVQFESTIPAFAAVILLAAQDCSSTQSNMD